MSPSTIDKGKDSTSLKEVVSVPMDKQQTEEQSGEDESESFEETLGENQGNLTSFNITIKFERRQYKIFFVKVVFYHFDGLTNNLSISFW